MHCGKILTVLALLPLAAFAAEVEETPDRWYAGVSGAVFLPGGGSSLSRAGGVSAYLGYFLSDSFALEAGILSVPNAVSSRGGNASLSGFGVSGAWHFMGFERFDPFLSFGAESLFSSSRSFGGDSRRCAFGPSFGFGFLYHLTDNLALRADSKAVVLLDSPSEMAFTVSGGLQWSFGGGEAAAETREESGTAAEKFVVKDENDPFIATVAGKIKALKPDRATVVGHIDCKLGMGRERASRLSLAAAEKVKAKLVAAGADGEIIEVRGDGFSSPLKAFDFAKGAPENNRVEILIGVDGR